MNKIIAIIISVLLSVYLWLTYGGINETNDAKVVESVQISLQATLSKGVSTLQLPPSQIHPLNIVNAAKSSFPQGVKVDEQLNLSIFKTDRGAQFKITDSGDLLIVSLKNFTRYHIQNGRIVRNNSWPMQNL